MCERGQSAALAFRFCHNFAAAKLIVLGCGHSPKKKLERGTHLSMKACPKCGAEYPDTTTLCPSDGVALEKTDDALIGQILAGKYRIDERLSGGGMGTVYRGTHVLMDKTVAIK